MDYTALPYESPGIQVIELVCSPVCQFGGSPTGESYEEPVPYDGF